MPECCAFGCNNRGDNQNKNKVRKFRFPKDKQRRAIWEAKVRKNNWRASDNDKICEVSEIINVYIVYF